MEPLKSASFLKKGRLPAGARKRLLSGGNETGPATTPRSKSFFASFFSKKEVA
jgi:hypothetical protein